MISLTGLGAAPGSFQGAQQNMQALRLKEQEQQAMAAFGQALVALAQQGGGLPGLSQPPQVRLGLPQPQQAMPGPAPFTDNVRLAPLPGPTGNQGVDDLTQALLRKSGNASPTGGETGPGRDFSQGFNALGTSTPSAPAPSPSTQVAAGGPAVQPPQQAAQPPIKLPPTAGIQPGSLTWPAVVNAIKAANPKIAPAVLAQAVNQFMPLMREEEASKWKAIAEERLSKADVTDAASKVSEIGDVVDRIISGEFPPPGAAGSSGRYPTAFNAAISQELAKRGYNLTSHVADYNAMQKMIQAQNSPVAVRFIGAIDTADKFLDTFKTNIDQWNAGNLPKFVNEGILKIRESNILPDAEAQKRAAMIKSQYAEMVNLIGGVFQNGGVPTDAARKLAAEQLELGWSRGTIDAVIDQIRGLLADRKAAIRGVQPYTPGGGQNTYMPAPAAQPGASAPAQGGGGASRITDAAGYNALPDGAHYIAPDGREYVKGAAAPTDPNRG